MDEELQRLQKLYSQARAEQEERRSAFVKVADQRDALDGAIRAAKLKLEKKGSKILDTKSIKARGWYNSRQFEKYSLETQSKDPELRSIHNFRTDVYIDRIKKGKIGVKEAHKELVLKQKELYLTTPEFEEAERAMRDGFEVLKDLEQQIEQRKRKRRTRRPELWRPFW